MSPPVARIRDILVALLWALCLAGLSSADAAAQGYPTRPVRLIVPLAPGGPADTTARLFATALAAELAQSVVTENRSGASGVVGTEAVVRAAPDGYTLLFGSSSAFSVNPAVMKGLRFDVRKDLRLIGLVSATDFMLVVHAGSPMRSVADVVGRAKAEPGRLRYATSGAGGIIHLTQELFNLEAGIELIHIPFRGGGPAVIGILTGDADMGFIDVSTSMTHIRSAKLAALGIASTRRFAGLPDLPTIGELGWPKVETRGWYGLAAPAAMPAEAVRRLEAATVRIAATPAFQADLAKAGLQPLVMSPAETAAFIEADLAKWARVAKAAGIQIDQ